MIANFADVTLIYLKENNVRLLLPELSLSPNVRERPTTIHKKDEEAA